VENIYESDPTPHPKSQRSSAKGTPNLPGRTPRNPTNRSPFTKNKFPVGIFPPVLKSLTQNISGSSEKGKMTLAQARLWL
jgi:hypothetical protein